MRVYGLYYSRLSGFVLMFGNTVVSKQRGDFNLENMTYICKVVANFKSDSEFCNPKDLDYNATWKISSALRKSKRWALKEAVFRG